MGINTYFFSLEAKKIYFSTATHVLKTAHSKAVYQKYKMYNRPTSKNVYEVQELLKAEVLVAKLNTDLIMMIVFEKFTSKFVLCIKSIQNQLFWWFSHQSGSIKYTRDGAGGV